MCSFIAPGFALKTVAASHSSDTYANAARLVARSRGNGLRERKNPWARDLVDASPCSTAAGRRGI